MTDDELKQRDSLYRKLVEELDKRLLQNADNFDKAILTYSSAGLALSLGFLKDFVPIKQASASWMLYSSWALFVAAVLTTMGSYLLSQLAQRRELDKARRYYIECEDAAAQDFNWPATLTTWASYLAGGCFLMALIASTLFVAVNLEKGTEMTSDSRVRANNGATVPTMQQVTAVPATRGAPVPTMQSVPQSQPSTSAPAPAAPSGGSKGS